MSRLVLLGPQRFDPHVRRTVESLGVSGPLAVITAGWQERESEDDELREHLQRDVVDLLLYHRADDVMVRDAELAAALRERQQELQELQGLYRLRLEYALGAARELLARPGGGSLLEEQRRGAIQAVRTLDRQHLRRLRRLHAEFEERWAPVSRPCVARHRDQLEAVLERCGALLVAGGHVAVLLNRLRLFGVAVLMEGLPVIAWSAGAMVLTDRVVLFHDSPPQGPGNAEVLDAGLGRCRKVVALPHARRRLRLQDPDRVRLMARRFAPAACVVLEGEARLEWDGAAWSAAEGALRLGLRGRVKEMPAA